MESNWAGNYTYRAREIAHPGSLDELAGLVRAAPSVHALGTRHTFTGIGDAERLIALDRMGREIAVDPAAGTVSVGGAVTYAELADVLNREGVALANLASLPHISVAGAVATATHGSGDAKGNLATSVVELELMTASGEVMTVGREDDRFAGLVVGLGALGVVTRLKLEVQPYYEVRQDVYEGLSWEALFAHFDSVMGAGDSVSVFHRLGDHVEQVWVKRRVAAGDNSPAPASLLGAPAATVDRHPVWGADPANTTPQLGRPGPWSDRLPHFRSDRTPSSGQEIQSEFLVGREHGVEAVRILRDIAARIRPLLLVCEIRTIAPDGLWLSPEHERPSVGLHFTWQRRQREVEAVVTSVENALAALEARSHWGKLMTRPATEIAPRYPRLHDFLHLRDELDPRGAFVNGWLTRHVLGNR